MPDAPSGRQRLKQCAQLISHHLSDLQLIFDKDLLNILGPDGTQYIDLSYLQEAVPALADFNAAQLRRAIKYDAKELLELHPELDMVRRCCAFSETEALERMLFVDDIDISGHEDNPTGIFQHLLLPYPYVRRGLDNDAQDDNQSIDHGDEATVAEHESLNQQTVIRPFGNKPTRFFQGFCYVEYATQELSLQMSSRILARNNAVRVMPMYGDPKQWRKLESEYLSLRAKIAGAM
ncbi:hypothetical protein BGZ51_005617 [Haplosporangium sp. Z 767]|nr:hypothetical protein BGZ51_005617 [Haplosporangium sp. Z 767]